MKISDIFAFFSRNVCELFDEVMKNEPMKRYVGDVFQRLINVVQSNHSNLLRHLLFLNKFEYKTGAMFEMSLLSQICLQI